MTASDPRVGEMAKVILTHAIDTYQNAMHDETRWICTNEACDFETDNWHGRADEAIAAHQAAALSAAGFGLVADAKREAWDEGADAGSDNQCAWDGWRYGKGYPITNPYRAAAVRGEG